MSQLMVGIVNKWTSPQIGVCLRWQSGSANKMHYGSLDRLQPWVLFCGRATIFHPDLPKWQLDAQVCW